MKDFARILGMGWVTAGSMGRPGHIHQFASPEDMLRLKGKAVLGTTYKPFGRMDNFSKMGFSAISFALSAAGIPPVSREKGSPAPKRPVALMAESITGCLETDMDYQDTLARKGPPSPALFAYTLPSCFLGEAAIYYGLGGEAYMIEAQNGSGLTALSFAMDSLGDGLCEAAVCGICNSGPQSFPGAPHPGAVFLVIGNEPPAPSREAPDAPSLTITRQQTTTDRFYIGNNEITDLFGLVQKESL